MNTIVIEQPDTTVLEITVDSEGAAMTRKDPDGQYHELLVEPEDLEVLAASLMMNSVKALVLGETELAQKYADAANGVREAIG